LSACKPPRAKLIVSALFSSEQREVPVIEELERAFGSIDLVSERMPFLYTKYYEPEMGPNLRRRMISVKKPVSADSLVEAKGRTQRLEDRYRDTDGRRRCNLDPGLLSLYNFVLGTHKGYTHRIYLGRGVFADLTLIYQHGSYNPLEWTYPDYASQDMIRLLNLVREVYLWQSKHESGIEAYAT
jgi:hypothetical protein